MKRMMLYFGSFNPIHRGHVALAEYAVEQGLCDELALVVSPQNPLKEADAQAPELDRFEMAEIACAHSKYPDRIKPSVVEFLLPRPSYTVDTLRYLSENHGREMSFSILMGSDLVGQLDRWKEYETILDNYPLFVYPRRGAEVGRFRDRVTLLEGAPLQDYSSTDVREALENGEDASRMLQPEVAEYIRRKGLWTPESRLQRLTVRIVAEPANAALHIERGKLHYRRASWGDALNDFNRAREIDAANCEARQYVEMVQEILAFRYKDIYNP